MEETLHILMYRAFHAQRNALRAYLREMNLGAGQPKFIAYLAANGPCRQKAMADFFEVDPAVVSRMVESLRKGGFVTMKEDASNRRCNLVDVTEQGRQAAQAWLRRCEEVESVMLRGFSPEEQAQFAQALTRVRENVLAWEAHGEAWEE